MRFDRALRWTGRTLLAITVGLLLVVACGPETTDPPPVGAVEVGITTVGPGTVRQPSSGFVCRGDCTWTGPAEQATGFVATPDGTNAFVAWTGACPTLDATCTRMLEDGDATTATFAPHALRLQLTGDGEGEFRIQGPDIDIACTEDCAVGVPQALSLAITYFAQGSTETVLEDWGGACTGAPRSDYCLVPISGATDVSKTWRRPPVASDETYTTRRDTPRSFSASDGVLRNVIDTPGDTHTAILVTDVAHGMLDLESDGGFSYTPNAGFVGSDTFTYRARDAFGNLSNLATVTITVTVTFPPVIESFTADDASIEAGDSTTLRWSVTGADTITIDDGVSNLAIPNDATTIEVTPDSTTTYTLTATNTDGNTTRIVTVTVVAPDLPTIDVFTATPSTITTGDSSTLAWTVTNATFIEIIDDTTTVIYDGTALDSTIEVTPDTTTTYTLTATNTDGNTTATATVTVRVPPVIVFFTADDASIESGDSTTLRWNVTGADTIAINDGNDDLAIPNGATTIEVTPDTTTTYTLTATNPDGKTTDTVTVTVTVTISESLPIAVDDVYPTTQDSILRRNPGQGVLVNDIGDNLTAILVDKARDGNLTLRGNGSFTYVPNDGFTGTDTFTYFAHDGFANSNTATVTITVREQ